MERKKSFEFVEMCEALDKKEWISPVIWDIIEATDEFVKPRHGHGYAETENINDPYVAYIELRKMFDGMTEPVGKRLKVKKSMIRDAVKREKSRHPHNATYPGRLMARIEYLLNG